MIWDVGTATRTERRDCLMWKSASGVGIRDSGVGIRESDSGQ